MSDAIKRFVECYVPVVNCNLRCAYCYVIEQNRRNKEIDRYIYSNEQMNKAFSIKRWGGVCFFSLTAPGETLLDPKIVPIIEILLRNGHFVNVTTNGTIKNRFECISKFPEIFLERLHFSFSLHYIELLKRNLLTVFFDNINRIRESGCSFVLQLNLCDEYLPFLEEIKKISINNVGALPQLAVTRREVNGEIKLATSLSLDEYREIGLSFNSELFEFGLKNFGVKRKEFCYAGDWSFKLYLHNGILKNCYDSPSYQNIFDFPEKPIKFQAIGKNCNSPYCVNSTHFLSLGVIPEMTSSSYAKLRDRPECGWYSSKMREFLSGKLQFNNSKYGVVKKIQSSIEEKYKIQLLKISNKICNMK